MPQSPKPKHLKYFSTRSFLFYFLFFIFFAAAVFYIGCSKIVLECTIVVNFDAGTAERQVEFEELKKCAMQCAGTGGAPRRNSMKGEGYISVSCSVTLNLF
jgi:hypothetical protein